MPGSDGWQPEFAGFDWIDAPSPRGKRRQQRPAPPPDAMEQFLAWRSTMLQLVDLFRAAAPRLAAGVPDRFEGLRMPRRRQVGVLAKHWVVDEHVQPAYVIAEWGLAGPPPGVRSIRPEPPQPSDRLYLLGDGRIALWRAGPNVQRSLRLVDDADFVQIVHREGLSEQLRRRLVSVFDEAELVSPFVPNRPSIDHADVWGKVARPSGPPDSTPSRR
ncbi:MAG: hypothetical protein ACRDWN_05370 [Acidimicrobiales bacterium]